MKAASTALLALLDSGDDFEMADLWTIMLPGGLVLRYTDADIDLPWAGHIFTAGPVIQRTAITEKVGVEVATCTLTIDANDDDQVGGVPLIRFLARRGLDGATVKLERAFLPDWASPITGTLNRFSGKVTSVGAIGGTHAEVTVSSWMVLLNVNVPADLYQVGCLHTVYDAGCGLNAEAFAATGTITGAPTVRQFSSGLTTTAGDYAQGRVVFLTGAAAGLSRTIKANDGAGGFTLIQALPTAPAAGDTFKAYKGCDLTKGTCSTRFNNLGRFNGAPFVPVPETALGG